MVYCSNLSKVTAAFSKTFNNFRLTQFWKLFIFYFRCLNDGQMICFEAEAEIEVLIPQFCSLILVFNTVQQNNHNNTWIMTTEKPTVAIKPPQTPADGRAKGRWTHSQQINSSSSCLDLFTPVFIHIHNDSTKWFDQRWLVFDEKLMLWFKCVCHIVIYRRCHTSTFCMWINVCVTSNNKQKR